MYIHLAVVLCRIHTVNVIHACCALHAVARFQGLITNPRYRHWGDSITRACILLAILDFPSWRCLQRWRIPRQQLLLVRAANHCWAMCDVFQLVYVTTFDLLALVYVSNNGHQFQKLLSCRAVPGIMALDAPRIHWLASSQSHHSIVGVSQIVIV